MKKRVLVAVLDWGLGHASRCIPIIRELLEADCDVILGGTGGSLELLKKEFPALAVLTLPPYAPRYPVNGRLMACKMLGQFPKFLQVIKEENAIISRFVAENSVDIIISDNRFGCHNKNVKSIFITHQVNVLMPSWAGWLSPIINKINHGYIRKFSACWIPDDPRRSLTGQLTLSNGFPKWFKVEYIGWLSRFKPTQQSGYKYDFVVILSGPEPQRSILENLLLKQLERSQYSFFLVRGLPFGCKQYKANIVDYLASDDLQHLIESSAVVIARSGYSTVMDLLTLKKKAILIPTPGQTEQEYLAKTLKEKKLFYSAEQKRFNLVNALAELAKYEPAAEKMTDEQYLMKLAIRKLLV